MTEGPGDARIALVSSERGLRVDPDLPLAAAALGDAGWDPVRPEDLPDAAEWVVKPSVSAGSRDTARWTDRAATLAHAAELTAAGRTALAQPYLASVVDLGETAMLFIGGRFSHPVVLELELTEPSLFLPQAPEAAATLARAVEAELQQ